MLHLKNNGFNVRLGRQNACDYQKQGDCVAQTNKQRNCVHACSATVVTLKAERSMRFATPVALQSARNADVAADEAEEGEGVDADEVESGGESELPSGGVKMGMGMRAKRSG